MIEKAQRLLELETGTIYGPLEGRLRFALASPSAYRVGMSSLGLQIVYRLLNDQSSVTCERVFLPDAGDIAELQRSRTRLFTLESQTPVCDFDVIAFSISYELDYAAVVQMLELSGIPALSSERDETHPLVIAGGPCATFNPEPLAEIVDVFAIGDAEGLIAEVVQAIQDGSELDRDELLFQLATVPGVYVPRFYDPVTCEDGAISEVIVTPPAPQRVVKRVTSILDDYSGVAEITTPEAEFSDMLLVEVMRGCVRHCRFCAAGYMWLPPRPRKLPKFPNGARVGLVGSAVFDHPDALDICEAFTSEGREYSVSSTRIESLTPRLAEMMSDAGQRTITIAPEAGTERLRRILNKPTTDTEVFAAADMAADAGAARLKLYFMIGLPGETDEDVDAIPALARAIAERHPTIKLQLSVSCFVPKPWTPFQWWGMEDVKSLSAKLSRVKKLLGRDLRIELNTESPRGAHVQAWLARGDRRLAKIIVEAARNGGNYAAAAASLDIDTAYYANRLRPVDEALPWDVLDLGVNKDYLWKEYTLAQEGKLTAQCNVGTCKRCGVC